MTTGEEMAFNILKVGAELAKRFLQKDWDGTIRWGTHAFAHNFATLAEAKAEAGKHESVAIIWIDASHPAKWGEVVGQFQVVR